MIDLKYYELIGFDAPPNKNIVMDRLEQIKRKTVRYKLSKAKILLIKLILNEEVTFDNRDLMLLYNEINIACDNFLNNPPVLEFENLFILTSSTRDTNGTN